jgi:hypothetical protein
MPKFTSAERILVKSIVANLSIKRIPEQEIIKEIYNQTNKTLTHAGLFYVKEALDISFTPRLTTKNIMTNTFLLLKK